MNRSLRLVVILGAIAGWTGGAATAQVNYHPTPAPIVTAENEPWYLAGEPVMYSGNIYYRTGPQVYFNGAEMVRSGFFHDIPLYTRTTIEPYSLVFVPLRGGLMQPYERRRAGDVAGTVGSTAPSFPVVRSSEPYEPTIYQAATAPTSLSEPALFPTATPSTRLSVPLEHVRMSVPREQVPLPVGVARRVAPAAGLPSSTLRPAPVANALFIDYNGRRWFSVGTAVPLDRSRMTQIGEHHGFAVYAGTTADPTAIFVPVASDAAEFVGQYARRPSR